MMIQPPFLKPGDIVAIVAPGRKLAAEAIESAVAILNRWGFTVQVGENIFSSKHSYLSGNDAERLDDLQQVLNDPSVNAIICARGGYGTTRILEQLDFTAFKKNPKWICGFSDITALHLRINSLGVQSIHSTMPVLFSKKESASSVESLKNILIGESATLNAGYSSCNKIGKATGELVGGNLSLLVDSLSTASEINSKNKILIIEEIDEYVYRLDRMMVHLKRAGKLNELAGLVIGHMTNIKDDELPFGENVEQLIMNHVAEHNYPVAFNFPTGHDTPNLAWMYGAVGQLEVTAERSVLKF